MREPILRDRIARGLGLLKTKGKLLKRLIEERKKERQREERKIRRHGRS